MKLEEILTLIKAGYTKEDIAAFENVAETPVERVTVADSNNSVPDDISVIPVASPDSNSDLHTADDKHTPDSANPTINNSIPLPMTNQNEDRIGALENSVKELSNLIRTQAVIMSNIPQNTPQSIDEAMAGIANAILNPKKESV